MTETNIFLATLSVGDLHWLSGLMEGEGSFMRGTPSKPTRPIVSVSMTDEDVITRVASLWNVKYHRVRTASAKAHWRPQFVTRITGGRAADFMRALRPLMGARRQCQIDLALACWDERTTARTPKLSRDQGREIEIALSEGEGASDIALRYGVTKWSIYAIGQQRYFPDQRRYENKRKNDDAWYARRRSP